MNTEPQATMTKQQMSDRINLLSGEIDANEEENRQMQDEITALYQKIDALSAECRPQVDMADIIKNSNPLVVMVPVDADPKVTAAFAKMNASHGKPAD